MYQKSETDITEDGVSETGHKVKAEVVTAGHNTPVISELLF